jgi:hypothetical protein
MTEVLALAAALALPMVALSPLLSGLYGEGRSVLQRLGRLVVAAMAGLGVGSLASFFWLLAGGALGRGYVAAEVILWLVLWLGLVAWRRRMTPAQRSRAPAMEDPDPTRGSWGWETAASALVGIALALALWRLFRVGSEHPHGSWDAWAIWNHRARFIFRGGTGWRAAFSPELGWSHIDYPLLLPLSVARLWAYAGETPLAHAVVSALFTLAGPPTLAAAAAASAGRVAGAAAALLLLGTPGYVYMGATQYADVPLAALLAAALALMLEAERAGPRRARTLALGGLLLGFAAWTKNEGLPAAMIVVLVRTALACRARGLAASLRDLLAVTAGAALPAAAWLAFHASVAPSMAAEFTAQTGTTVAQKLVDGYRWRIVLTELAKALPGSSIGLPAIAVAVALLLGVRARPLLRSPAFVSAVLLYGAVVVAFLVTPYSLEWHLESAVDRLAMQPWPVLLLGLLASAPPAAGTPGAGSTLARDRTLAASGVSRTP